MCLITAALQVFFQSQLGRNSEDSIPAESSAITTPPPPSNPGINNRRCKSVKEVE